MNRILVVAACALGVVASATVAAVLILARIPEAVSAGGELPPSRYSGTLEYSLREPTEVFVLPHQLIEVSGLTDISPSEIGCVQDEDGVIFVYDLVQRRVTRSIRFSDGGDFEGLASVGGSFFVLRSDGLLHEVSATDAALGSRIHEIDLPTKNHEGLGFDRKNNRLLIAPRSRLGRGKKLKNKRAVYAFDLARRTMLPEPVLEFDIEEVQMYADTRGLPIPVKRKKKRVRPALLLMPSAVAVHPISGDVYVVSAEDGVLASFNTFGVVTGYALLSPRLFPQPEGIAFASSGDMFIANEGDGGEPTLLFFEWLGPEPHFLSHG